MWRIRPPHRNFFGGQCKPSEMSPCGLNKPAVVASPPIDYDTTNKLLTLLRARRAGRMSHVATEVLQTRMCTYNIRAAYVRPAEHQNAHKRREDHHTKQHTAQSTKHNTYILLYSTDDVSHTSFGTLSCFLPLPPLRTILRINSTRFSGESAYLSNKNEVPDDEHRARPPLDADAVHGGGGTAAVAAEWVRVPTINRWSNRHLNPRDPICLHTYIASPLP